MLRCLSGLWGLAFLTSIDGALGSFTLAEFNGPDGGLPPPGFHDAQVPRDGNTMFLAVYSPNRYVQAGVNASDPRNITMLRGLPCFPAMLNAALIAFNNGSVLAPPSVRAPSNVFLWFADTCPTAEKCGNVHTLSLMTELMLGVEGSLPPVRAVLGGYSYTKPIAQVGGAWNTPNIGYFSFSREFSDKKEFPFFLRACPSGAKMWEAVAALLQFLKYTRIMIWHSKNERGEEAKDVFFENRGRWNLDAQAAQVPDGQHVAVPPDHWIAKDRGGDNGVRESVWKTLVVQAKNYNAHAHVNAIVGGAPVYDLITYLSQNGLFGPGYLWVGEDTSVGIYHKEYLYAIQFARVLQNEHGNCPPDGSVPTCFAMQTPMDGYVTVRPQQEGARYPVFWAWWQSLKSRRHELFESWIAPDLDQGFLGDPFADPIDGIYTAWWRLPAANFLFDGMWATLLGLNAALLEHGPDFTGEQYLKVLKSLSFEGITGHVSFDEAGDRRLNFEILQYMRPCPNSTGRRLHESRMPTSSSSALEGSLEIPHLRVLNPTDLTMHNPADSRRAQANSSAPASQCTPPRIENLTQFFDDPFKEYMGCLSRHCEDMHPALVATLTGGIFKSCTHLYLGMCKKCGFDIGGLSPALPIRVFFVKGLCPAQCPRGPTSFGQPAEQYPACPGYPLPPEPLGCFGYPEPGRNLLIGSYSESLVMDGHPMQFHSCSSTVPPNLDLPCDPGHWYDRLKATCEVCALGTYAAGIGQSACDSCPPGTFGGTVAQSACVACKQGSVSNHSEAVECTLCERGQFQSEIQQSQCRDCETGTYAESDGAHNCERCPLGKYVAFERASWCLECSAGRSTQFRSSISESECHCTEGTYNSPSTGTCDSCPEGMFCAFASDLSNWYNKRSGTSSNITLRGGGDPVYPELQPQYWSDPHDPLNVFLCKTDRHCPGGDPGTCAERLQEQSCSHCMAKYYWDGEECAACSDMEGSKWIFPTLPLAAMPVLLIGLYSLFGDPVEKWDSWANHCASILFVLLSNYQAVDLLSDLKMHKLLKSVTSIFSFTNDLLSIFRADCLGVGKFKEALTMQFLCPLVLLAWTIIVYFGAKLAAQTVATAAWCKLEKNRLFNVYMSLIFTFFNAVSSLSMALFKCRGNPNRSDTLAADLSIICYESQEWKSLLGVAILAILIYCIGCGLLFCWAICTARSRFSNPDFQMRWKFLFIKFRPDVWWFALAFLAKQILLNLSFAISTDLTAQLCSVLFVLVAYSFLVCAFMPYRMPLANALEIMGNICTSYLCIILLTMEDNQRHEDTLAIIGACMTGIPLLLGLSVLSHVASGACPRVRDRQWEQHLQDSVKFVQCVQILSRMDQKLIAACLTGMSDWDRRFMNQVSATIRAELFGQSTRKRCSTGELQNMEQTLKFKQNDLGHVVPEGSDFQSKYTDTGVTPVEGKEKIIMTLTRRLSNASTASADDEKSAPKAEYGQRESSTWGDEPAKTSENMVQGEWQPPRELHVSMVTPRDKPNPGASKCHNLYAMQPSTVGRASKQAVN